MAALSRFHADERGSISFATVFAVLLLTMLLGMAINTGRQIDNKVKLQNAADASTYSGGVVLARGMVLCSADALRSIKGKRTADLPAEMAHEVVHRDDLVLLS